MYGFGRGAGFGRGCGFGFRGASPPWPFVGVGRGGLPRCGYFLGWGGIAPWAYPPGYSPRYARSPFPSYAPFTPPMSKEEELNYLKEQAEAIREELERIEARVKELSQELK